MNKNNKLSVEMICRQYDYIGINELYIYTMKKERAPITPSTRYTTPYKKVITTYELLRRMVQNFNIYTCLCNHRQ